MISSACATILPAMCFPRTSTAFRKFPLREDILTFPGSLTRPWVKWAVFLTNSGAYCSIDFRTTFIYSSCSEPVITTDLSNAVLLNSAAGLYISGKVDSLRDGVKLAEEIIDSGKALKQLERFIECTNR